MVIYYGRDPEGRRVEIPVSKAEHKEIQAAGGWRQSGAEAHYEGQIAVQRAVAPPKPVPKEIPPEPKPVVKPPAPPARLPLRPEIIKKYAPAVLPLRPEIIEAYRPPPPLPPKPEFLEPPGMPKDIHVTAPTPFTMYKGPPQPEIKMGPPTEWLKEEGRPPTTEELGVLGPKLELEPPKPSPVPIHETVSVPFLEAREEAAKEVPDIFTQWIELAEPLIPKKTEREIAYPTARVGIEPIIGFGAGVAYGVVTFVPSVIKIPKTVYGIITKPGEAIKGIIEEFVKEPTFAIGKILGGVITGVGISRLIGWGITKFRPREAVAEARITPMKIEPARMRYDLTADLMRGTKFIKGKGVAKVYYTLGKTDKAYARIAMDIKTSLKKFYPTKIETTILKLGKGITRHERLTLKTGMVETLTKKGVTYIKRGFRYEHPEMLGKPYQVTLTGKPAAMQTVIKGLTGEKLYFQKLIMGKEWTYKITVGRGAGLYEVTPQYMARTAAQYRTALDKITRVAYKGKRIKIREVGVGVAKRGKYYPPSIEKTLQQMGIGKYGPAAKVVTKAGKAWQLEQARMLAAVEQSMKLVAETAIKPPKVIPVSAPAAARAAIYAAGKFPTITKVIRPITRVAPVVATVSQIAGAGKAEEITRVREEAMYPTKLETAFPKTAMKISPWAKTRLKEREDTMQRLGLGTGQVQATLSQLGIGQVTIPRERVGVFPRIGVITRTGVTQKQWQKQRQAQRQVQAQALGFPPPSVPGIGLGIPLVSLPKHKVAAPPILFPLEEEKIYKRKKKRKPRYKYKEKRYPFPTIKELMGV